MDRFLESQIGVIVQCENGHIYTSANYDKVQAFGPDGIEIAHWSGGGDHFKNFLDAVRSGRREDLHAEVLEGHVSSACATSGTFPIASASNGRLRISSRKSATIRCCVSRSTAWSLT